MYAVVPSFLFGFDVVVTAIRLAKDTADEYESSSFHSANNLLTNVTEIHAKGSTQSGLAVGSVSQKLFRVNIPVF